LTDLAACTLRIRKQNTPFKEKMKRQRIMRTGILKALGIFSFFLLCASSLWAAAPEDMIRQAIIERLLDNDKQSIKRETPCRWNT
jgi:hypothetical protein